MNARGSAASDYARYAEYEMNLDSLRRKRSKRLGVKLAAYTGQRRVFFILDRATRKFHGDTTLWLQYVTFARGQKANKKVTQIITNMLRLHPASPKLWTYAADYALNERGDVTEARSYMQRGLRFCSQSKYLWSEYLKLEMIYIAKILTRRHILGLDSITSNTSQLPDNEAMNADPIILPQVAMEDMGPKHQRASSCSPEELNDKFVSSPALSGTIPTAIFDSATKKFPGDATFGAQMFGIVAEFCQLQCTRRILQHITKTLMTSAPTDAASLNCFMHEPVIGLGPTSTQLPGALIQVLDRFDSTMRKLGSPDDSSEQSRTRASVSQHLIQWIMPYLNSLELDLDIRAVLNTTLNTAWEYYLTNVDAEVANAGAETIALLEDLHDHGFKEMVQSGLASALRMWPDEPHLLALETSTS